MDDKNVIYNIGTLLSFQATDHTPPYLPLVAFHPVFLVGAHAGLNEERGWLFVILATPSPGQPAHLI
ncbi:hypothetical protein [Rothia nasisuis]|uniref:hypothetical protein n=1 Tax=Rothia nasisuis TaxID=2109647 RepID=UPI001F21D422|nr:hypothetical protein [Rothia nasisuis]